MSLALATRARGRDPTPSDVPTTSISRAGRCARGANRPWISRGRHLAARERPRARSSARVGSRSIDRARARATASSSSSRARASPARTSEAGERTRRRAGVVVACAGVVVALAMTQVMGHKRTYNEREETPLEHAVIERAEEGASLLRLLPRREGHGDAFFPALDDAIFVGHLVTDLDSIAGAIGAAHLYGGTPARASEVNTETTFALETWGASLPAPVEDLLRERPNRNVCLVDFQQQSQLNKSIPMANIIGVIDHHALQSNTIVTEKPIFVDIRPWGCMSSIIAHSYAVQHKFLPKYIAGMLLSAILSDTLNLKSPTTTAWDERIVAMLVQYLEVEDVNELAARQFRAKSQSLNLMTPYSLVNGDMKQFKFSSDGETYEIAYSVIETTDAATSLARAADILPEMRAVKLADTSISAVLLAVVDIVNLNSTLLICGRVEASLAVAAYGGELQAGGTLLHLPGLVSRKKDFVPPLTKAFKDGWLPPRLSLEVNPKSTMDGLPRTRSMADVPIGELDVVFSDEAPSGLLIRSAHADSATPNA